LELMLRLQVYIVSFSILLIIYIKLKVDEQIYYVQDRLFKYLTLSTMYLLFFESVNWYVNGRSGKWSYYLNLSSNLLILMMNMLPLAIWTLYIMCSFNKSNKYLIKGFIPMGIIMTINIFFALSSLINKRYFYIDKHNLYHRGDLAIVGIVLYVLLIIYSMFVTLYNWSNINKRNRMSMLLFPLPPVIAFVIQMMFYGTSLLLPAATISILMAYSKCQHQSQFIKTDYLTGLYNRRELDLYLERKLKNLPTKRKLAGIMIDLDDFKFINDQYGHIVGDTALRRATSIIEKCFHKNEFVARYGGDEFIILFEIKNEIELHNRVGYLRNEFELFNKKKEEVFELGASIGASIYSQEDKQSSMFLERLDFLMYEDKKNRKSIK